MRRPTKAQQYKNQYARVKLVYDAAVLLMKELENDESKEDLVSSLDETTSSIDMPEMLDFVTQLEKTGKVMMKSMDTNFKEIMIEHDEDYLKEYFEEIEGYAETLEELLDSAEASNKRVKVDGETDDDDDE